MRAVERVALAGTFAFLFGGVFFTPPLATREDAAAESVCAPALADPEILPAADRTADERDPDSNDAFTDLYGNEINDALATYTFDQSGSLYELHSPQTELPRLGSPKS